MKKTLISISIIVILVTIVDMTVGIVAKSALKKCDPSSFYGEINHAIEDLETELLIIGASRAKSHYVPDILIDSLGLSTYNAGSDGKNILYHSCVGNAVIERAKPKLIILDLAHFEFQWDAKDRVSVLNPYYGKDSLISATVNMKSSTEPIKMISNMYRYNSILLTIFKNVISGSDDTKSNGFRRLEGTNKYLKYDVLQKGGGLEEESIERFKWFIQLCKKNRIDLMVCISPAYVDIIETPKTIELIENICTKEDVAFLNYLEDDQYVDNNMLFKDNLHLNIHGSEKFTRDLIKHIKIQLL